VGLYILYIKKLTFLQKYVKSFLMINKLCQTGYRQLVNLLLIISCVKKLDKCQKEQVFTDFIFKI